PPSGGKSLPRARWEPVTAPTRLRTHHQRLSGVEDALPPPDKTPSYHRGMTSQTRMEAQLREPISTTAREAGAEAAAVVFHDYHTGQHFSYNGDRWMHAASTIKVPVLVGVFAAIQHQDLTPNSRIHVRNRFYSVVDGSAYRVESGRD